MRRTIVALVAACLVAAPCAAAQTKIAPPWPRKTIKLMVPHAPGGIEAYARAMLPKMSEQLGQRIELESREDGNAIAGTEQVVRSPADGYTLLFASASTLVEALTLKKVSWDPARDLTPIIALYDSVRAITVPASLPIRSIRELIDHCKQNPGKLSYGSPGIGSALHLDGEIFKDAAGIDVVHVPAQGPGALAEDIAAGRIQVGIAGYHDLRPSIEAGKLRLLAVFEKKRVPLLPDVPALAETLPGVVRSPSMTGILGPARLPRPIVIRVHLAARTAMNTPEVRAVHEKDGNVVAIGSAEQTAKEIQEGLARAAELMKKIKLQPQ